MSWMHHPDKQVTLDRTPEDTYWRERCEKEFGLKPDPAERERYPEGYWQDCHAYWTRQALRENEWA